jgi:hypothetical protein
MLFSAYGVGEELVSSEPPQSLLSDIISNALPSQSLLGKDGKINEYFSSVLQSAPKENGSSESVETSSMSSNNNDSHNRAPGSQLHNKGMNKNLGHGNSMSNGTTISSLQNTIINNSNNSNLISNAFQDFSPDISKQILAIDKGSAYMEFVSIDNLM